MELIVVDKRVRFGKSDFITNLERALAERSAGRVLGSGLSLVCDESLVVEVGVYNRIGVEEAIESTCRAVKAADYYTQWD
jgi:hypothetical protein